MFPPSPLAIFKQTDKVIYHLISFSEVSKGKTGQHKDLLFDPAKDNWGVFYSELKRLNSLGYNVYSSINLYTDKLRQKKDLLGYRGFMIDIDSKEGYFHYSEIMKKVNSLNKNLGIYPVEINETYKGYHIVYGIHYLSQNMKDDVYMDMFNFLVTYFQWDKRATKVTGLYKIAGFIDHKRTEFGEPRNYEIKNVYRAVEGKTTVYQKSPDILITHKMINDLLYFHSNPSILLKKKKATPVISEDDIKTVAERQFVSSIEEIDARDLINALNRRNESGIHGFEKRIIVRGTSIDDTNGLKLYGENGKATFKDFTNKGRYGIYGFLYNYYFDIPNNAQNGVDKFFMFDFLHEEFGIKRFEQKNDTSTIGLNILANFVYGEFCYADGLPLDWRDFQLFLKFKRAINGLTAYSSKLNEEEVLIRKQDILKKITEKEMRRVIDVLSKVGKREKMEVEFNELSYGTKIDIEELRNILNSIDTTSESVTFLEKKDKESIARYSEKLFQYFNQDKVIQHSYSSLLDISESGQYLVINSEKEKKYFQEYPKKKIVLPKKFLEYLLNCRSEKAFLGILKLYWGYKSFGKYKTTFEKLWYKNKSSVHSLIDRAGLSSLKIKTEGTSVIVGNIYNNK